MVALSWLYFLIFSKFPIFPKFGGCGSMVALLWLYFSDFSEISKKQYFSEISIKKMNFSETWRP